MLKKHILPILLLAGTVAVFGCSNNSSPEKPGTENNAETQKEETPQGAEDSIDFSFEFAGESSVKDLISYNAAKHTFVAKDGFTSYRWMLNGVQLSPSTGFLVLTDDIVNICELKSGKNYTVMVIVTDRSETSYSSTLEFKYEKED